jgi:fluoride ion exporter CrcB/FEX
MRGAMVPAAAYLLVSVGGALVAVFVGLAIARAVFA